MGYIDDEGNETKNAVLKPERELCECPKCGSAASTVWILGWSVPRRYEDGHIVVGLDHITGKSFYAEKLLCDDCGHPWGLNPTVPIQWE